MQKRRAFQAATCSEAADGGESPLGPELCLGRQPQGQGPCSCEIPAGRPREMHGALQLVRQHGGTSKELRQM